MTTPSTKVSDSSRTVPFIFFGTGPIAREALSTLKEEGHVPSLIVTAPDRPQGRGMTLTPSLVASWADEYVIPTLKPEKIDPEFLSQLQPITYHLHATVFVVIDYGLILPKKLLEIPGRGVLNMHPSLLPRLRGPSPIRSAILNDERETGVTVMLVDEKMDHGPIVAQKKVAVNSWPPRGSELDSLLAREGAELLARVLPLWANEEIEAQPQNHDLATFSQMFSKEDGLLDPADDAYRNLLKIRAFEGWPGTYTYFEKDEQSASRRIRVKILDAHLEGERLILDTVRPEGKSEMPYTEFLKSGARPTQV